MPAVVQDPTALNSASAVAQAFSTKAVTMPFAEPGPIIPTYIGAAMADWCSNVIAVKQTTTQNTHAVEFRSK